jgi:hypothetical protein
MPQKNTGAKAGQVQGGSTMLCSALLSAREKTIALFGSTGMVGSAISFYLQSRLACSMSFIKRIFPMRMFEYVIGAVSEQWSCKHNFTKNICVLESD